LGILVEHFKTQRFNALIDPETAQVSPGAPDVFSQEICDIAQDYMDLRRNNVVLRIFGDDIRDQIYFAF
jgi:hypothetical protein